MYHCKLSLLKDMIQMQLVSVTKLYCTSAPLGGGHVKWMCTRLNAGPAVIMEWLVG